MNENFGCMIDEFFKQKTWNESWNGWIIFLDEIWLNDCWKTHEWKKLDEKNEWVTKDSWQNKILMRDAWMIEKNAWKMEEWKNLDRWINAWWMNEFGFKVDNSMVNKTWPDGGEDGFSNY